MNIIEDYEALLRVARHVVVTGKFCQEWHEPPNFCEEVVMNLTIDGEHATLRWYEDFGGNDASSSLKFPSHYFTLSPEELEVALARRLADLQAAEQAAANQKAAADKERRRQKYLKLKKEFDAA